VNFIFQGWLDSRSSRIAVMLCPAIPPDSIGWLGGGIIVVVDLDPIADAAPLGADALDIALIFFACTDPARPSSGAILG
jgi:hypothetical protein